MLIHQTRHISAAALIGAATLMRSAARHMRSSGVRLEAWLEKRRIAAAALREFETMSERDLLDIGLTPVDLNRVAWGASDRF